MNRFFNHSLRFPVVFQLATVGACIFLVLVFFTHFVDRPRYQDTIVEFYNDRSISFAESVSIAIGSEILETPGTFPTNSFYQFASRPLVSDALVVDCSGEIYISKDSTMTGNPILPPDRQAHPKGQQPELGPSYVTPELYTQVANTGVSISRELSNTARFYLNPLPCIEQTQANFPHAVLLMSFDSSEIVQKDMSVVNGITLDERIKWVFILLLIAAGAWLSIYPRVSRIKKTLAAAEAGNFEQPYNSQALDELDQIGESLDKTVASLGQRLAAVKNEAKNLELGYIAFRCSDQAICILSSNQRVVDINPAYEKLTGHSKNEMIGRTLLSILPDNMFPDGNSGLINDNLLANAKYETWSYKKNGSRFRKLIHVRSRRSTNGTIENYFCVETDITLAHEQHEKLELLAKTDPLTGIYNRRKFDSDLYQLFSQGKLNFAIGIINLDSMREINSEYGKGCGDAVIIESGRRLLLAVSGNNKSVYRFEGDEFYVLFFNVTSEHELERQAKAVLSNLVGEAILADANVDITAGMGVAVYDKSGGTDATLMLNQANLALRHAKSIGRSKVVLAKEYVLSAEKRKLSISLALKSSRLTDHLRLSYLPRINIQHGILAGADALIRWDFSQLGYISKEEFFSIAEKTGDISRIDEWSINRALMDTARFAKHIEGFQTAIKVSSQQFLKESFSADFMRQAKRLNIPPESLALELTEKTILENSTGALSTINSLRKEGINIHIQDLGLGYPPSRELRELPIDALKLNQTLLGRQPNLVAIKTAILLAKEINVPLIAEGVESTYHLNLLRDLGCDFCQGYLYSEPVPIDPDSDTKLVLSDWQRSIESVMS